MERFGKEPGIRPVTLPVNFSSRYYAFRVEPTKKSNAHRATASATVAVPVAFAIPATEVILNELRSNGSVTALDLPTLRSTFEEIVGAPIELEVKRYQSHEAWLLRVHAASCSDQYPAFEGVLYLDDAGAAQCVLTVAGTMVNGQTRPSLERFARGMSVRIAVLTRWAKLT